MTIEISNIREEIKLEEIRIAEMIRLLYSEENKFKINLPKANEINTDIVNQRDRNDELIDYIV